MGLSHLQHHDANARRALESQDTSDAVRRNTSPGLEESVPLIVERVPAPAPTYISPDNFGLPSDTPSSGSNNNHNNNNNNNNNNNASPSPTSSTYSTPTSCGGNPCAYNTSSSSTTTIPIILGVVIPVVIFSIAMIVIWRIKKKRDLKEKENDRHASLDFGLGEVNREKKGGRKPVGRGRPDMMDLSAEKAFRQARGLSMDMGSPYIMAPELTRNRPSFTSLSRSNYDGEDPYAPVAMIRGTSPIPGYNSRPESRKDSASVWTASSEGFSGVKGSLLAHAQQPAYYPPSNETYPSPSSNPGTVTSPLLGSSSASPPLGPDAPASRPDFSRKPLPIRKDAAPAFVQGSMGEAPITTHVTVPGQQEPSSQDRGFDFNLPAPVEMPSPSIHVTEADDDVGPPPPPKRSASLKPPGGQNPSAMQHEPMPQYDDNYQTYADVLDVAPKTPDYGNGIGLGVHGYGMDSNRLSVNMRPLPPDDPEENPESRANRIRSFYREYFDDKRDARIDGGYDAHGYAGYGGTPSAGGYGGTEYYEDYNQEYLNSATVVDPASGRFVVGGAPFAQPITRRAMTPPPRAPPRFRNGSSAGYRSSPASEYGSPRGRVRGYSTASGQRKKMPPPAPLNNLPTPYLLKDDAAIFNAMDFAPPTSYKDRQAGRPESPMMDQRPYSPSVRPFTPLASSFAELPSMPSPHLLRKSGTFTALDFAPRARFLGDTGSDAGSIRSGRSNMSASQLASMRNGAYRVSRIPKGVVGTKDDFAMALRPTWDAGRGPS